MSKTKKTSKKGIKRKGEILKELAESIKKISKPNEKSQHLKESELERDIREVDSEDLTNLDQDNIRFNNFVHSMHSLENLKDVKAPILERIAGSQPIPVFFGGGSQKRIELNEEKSGEKDAFGYIAGKNTKNQPEYTEHQHIIIEAEKIDFTKIGREAEYTPKINQEKFFDETSEFRKSGFESQSIERLERARRLNTENLGREKEEVKYEKYKPRLPKSW